MGIKDLNLLLRKHCPHVFQQIHISQFEGKRVAVDISAFIYKYLKGNGEAVWLDSILMLLCSLKKYKVIAVLIYDGKHAPPEKEVERTRRREALQRLVDKKNNVCHYKQQILDNYLNGTVPIEMQNQIRDLTQRQKLETLTKATNKDLCYSDGQLCYSLLCESEGKLAKQSIAVTDEHVNQVHQIANILGIPQVRAKGEAETVCCGLILHHDIDAVLTDDTDVLAYGVPKQLSKYDWKTQQVTQVLIQDVLDALEMTQEQFRDLCIMCGCDYNSRTTIISKTGKTVNVGATRAFNLLKEYDSIDNIPNLDLEPLNHIRCRRLFRPPRLKKFSAPRSQPYDRERLQFFVEKHNCNVDLDELCGTYDPVQMLFDQEEE